MVKTFNLGRGIVVTINTFAPSVWRWFKVFRDENQGWSGPFCVDVGPFSFFFNQDKA